MMKKMSRMILTEPFYYQSSSWMHLESWSKTEWKDRKRSGKKNENDTRFKSISWLYSLPSFLLMSSTDIEWQTDVWKTHSIFTESISIVKHHMREKRIQQQDMMSQEDSWMKQTSVSQSCSPTIYAIIYLWKRRRQQVPEEGVINKHTIEPHYLY